MYFDASRYLRPPQVGAASGFFLAFRLLRVAPKQPKGRVHTALARMRARAERVQEVLRERARLGSLSLRPLDQDFDGAWAVFHMRLAAHARKPRGPHRQRVTTLLADLFPGGLSFLTWRYEEQWLHSNTLLQRFESEKLEDELDTLAGDSFLADVRAAHEVLGEAMGIGKSEPAQAPSLLDAVTDLAHAIADYGRVLAGEVDSEDPKSIARFGAAMKPRDEHMARRGRPQGETAPESPESLESIDQQEHNELLDTELPELPPMLEEGA